MNSHINNNTTTPNYQRIFQTLPTYINGNFTYLHNNFAYIIFNSNGSILFKEDTPCELLITGAGGRGGSLSIFGGSGGGGSGEIIYNPSFTFPANSYDIHIGIDSPDSNQRISKISFNNQTLIQSIGGGDGSFWDGNTLGDIQKFHPLLTSITSSPIIQTTFNNRPCFKTTIFFNSNPYEVFYSSRTSPNDPFNLFHTSNLTYFEPNQYLTSGTSFTYIQGNYLVENTYKGDWICIKFPIPISITSYSFVQNSLLLGGAPNNYKIYGSVDGISWNVITERNSSVSLIYSSNYIYTDTLLPQNIQAYLYFALVVRSILQNIGYLTFKNWIIEGKPIIITPPTLNGGSSIFSLPSNQIQGGFGGSFINQNLIKTIQTTSTISIKYDNHFFKINRNPPEIYINSGEYSAIFNEGFINFAGEIFQSFPHLNSIEPLYSFKLNSSNFNDNLIITNNITKNTYDIFFEYGSYITISPISFEISNGISFSFWIKPEIIDDKLWIFGNGIDFISFHQNQFKFMNNNHLTIVDFSNNLIDGSYHHLVCSINPSGIIFVSCDGINFQNSSLNPFVNRTYTIGKIGEFFQGSIKDFRIYPKFLEIHEIQELFKGRIEIFYNRFEENLTTTTIQIGSGGIGGTASSVPTIKNHYGDGGDANGGLGFQGIVIIKYPYPYFNSILTSYKFPNSQFLKFSGLNNPYGIPLKLLENKNDNRLFSINDLQFLISSNTPYIHSSNEININNGLFTSSNIGFGTSKGIHKGLMINDFLIEKNSSNISFINPLGFFGIGTTNPKNFLDIRNNVSISKLNIFGDGDSNLNIFGDAYLSGDANIGNLILNGVIYKANGIPYIDSGWTGNQDIYNSYSIVGIGTTFPRFQNRLDVNGSIKCNEVYVDGALLTYDFINNSGTTMDTISLGTLKKTSGGTGENSFGSNQILNSTLLWSNDNSLMILGNLNNSNENSGKIVLKDGIKIGNILIDKNGINNDFSCKNLIIKSGIVGIGSSNPLSNLDVIGNVGIKGVLEMSNLNNNEVLNGKLMNVSNIIIENSGIINRFLSRWNGGFLGFVGIGTTNPINNLDINGNLAIRGVLAMSNINNNEILNGIWLNVSNISLENSVITYKNNNNFIGSRWNLNNKAIFYNNGFVGIGTTNPLSNLDINGNMGMRGFLDVSNISNIDFLNGRTLNVSNLRFLTNSSGIVNLINGNTFNLNNWTSEASRTYYNYGNVGIRTSINQSNSIDINGDFNFSSNISNLNTSIFNFENFIGSISTSPSIVMTNNPTNNSYGYYQFTTANSIIFNKDIYCDVLVVGAGGNGGSGAFSGGGGAGEVIYQPNYLFEKGSYDLTIGFSSTTISNRISKIMRGSMEIFKALGGGDGNIINLILWYKFDDASNFLNDTINPSNNLINTGATFDNINSIKGNGSIKFNASSSQYARVPANINLNAINSSNGISFSWWAKNNSSSGTWARLFDWGNQNSVGYGKVYIMVSRNSTSTDHRFEVTNPSGDNAGNTNSSYFVTSGTNYFDGSWRHYVWTITTGGVWNIYVNNSKILNNSSRIIIPAMSGTLLYYFGKSLYPDGAYDGNIDDFRVYNFVLNDTQVQELYTSSQSIQIEAQEAQERQDRIQREQSTITSELIDSSPVLTEDQEFNKNNRAYEYIHKYDINYLNLNSITPNTKIDNGITTFTKQNSNIKYEYSSSNSASNNPTNLFNNKLQTNINIIYASFASNRYNSGGNFIGNSAIQGDFISIEFPEPFKLKKYSFISKDIQNAPASWILYAGDNLIEEKTANKTDYDETLTKSPNTYVSFLNTNEISAKKYKIVFKKTFGGTTLNFGQIKLEEGREATIQATSPSSFPPEDNYIL